jgi:ATP-dependent Clp protease ATP-binding subunit ClpC
MFERYSLPSRRAIFYIREAALNAGAAEIDSMHILCGLTLEKSSRANSLFQLKKRFPEEAARMRTVKLASGDKGIPLTSESKRILAYAAEEANRMDDYWVDTDHLVLGILRERNCTAAARLEASGLRIEEARAQVWSSAPEQHDYGDSQAWWLPSKPTTIGGQIAAAMYLLLIVVLLKFFTEKCC